MPIAPSHFQKVVIDTSPLMDALTLELLRSAPRWETAILHKSPLHSSLANNPTNQRNFHALLDSIGEMLITSHVIGEIRSERHFSQQLHSLYWQACSDFFNSHRVSEKLVTLAELNDDEGLRHITHEFGPTDAGLVALANREECMLLTHDRRLYKWLGAFPKMTIQLVENLVHY